VADAAAKRGVLAARLASQLLTGPPAARAEAGDVERFL
jgi:hypothetical protein